jgi:hypothetical protein
MLTPSFFFRIALLICCTTQIAHADEYSVFSFIELSAMSDEILVVRPDFENAPWIKRKPKSSYTTDGYLLKVCVIEVLHSKHLKVGDTILIDDYGMYNWPINTILANENDTKMLVFCTNKEKGNENPYDGLPSMYLHSSGIRLMNANNLIYYVFQTNNPGNFNFYEAKLDTTFFPYRNSGEMLENVKLQIRKIDTLVMFQNMEDEDKMVELLINWVRNNSTTFNDNDFSWNWGFENFPPLIILKHCSNCANIWKGVVLQEQLFDNRYFDIFVENSYESMFSAVFKANTYPPAHCAHLMMEKFLTAPTAGQRYSAYHILGFGSYDYGVISQQEAVNMFPLIKKHFFSLNHTEQLRIVEYYMGTMTQKERFKESYIELVPDSFEFFKQVYFTSIPNTPVWKQLELLLWK